MKSSAASLTLRSRVARRLLLLFVGCALVPLVGLAAVTLLRTTGQLEEQAGRRLQYDVKAASMDALGRLELQANTLRVIGTTVSSGAREPDWFVSRIDELLPHHPRTVTYVSGDGRAIAIVGDAVVPVLSDAQRDHLERLGTLIWHDEPTGADMLVVRVETGRSPGLMVMAIDYAFVFGLDNWDVLPPFSDLCVLDHARRPVACSAGVTPKLEAQLAGLEEREAVVLDPDGESFLVRSWEIPLQFGYATDSWTAVMLRPESVIRAPVGRFLRDFWLVLLLALLVVTWLSLSQVRRQLRPLDALMRAIRRIGRRDFGQSVDIASGDEFEELGAAFNQLSGELRQQFDELEAFSIGTLEALARAIDAKSSWTAGHSDRVTGMAVGIAAEMQLPAEEVAQLRRGGLVHDIGKLATPPAILDKPSGLTAEEEAVIRKHPAEGFHILEPIPAFRPLLPMVLQHHERWDGTGYPHGLAGQAIARTARVLAVADVFDAMLMDRPYREGLPLVNVIATIQAGAGTQFDPEVVAAFVRLAHREAGRWEASLDRSA